MIIVDLADCRAGDGDRVGGKAANLGELIDAGMPVPPGFVITTAAYRRDGVITDELAAAIRKAYARLGPDVPVAVRSSATAEDLAQASFAGQQETYLNVIGTDDLLTALADCWRSLWSERAVHYRAQQEISDDGLALAVVVQELVIAESAGVMFTANPGNGRHDQLVISAAWGLGEAVVGGQVDTDDLVITGASITSRRTGDKTIMVRVGDRRTITVDVAADRRRAPVLDDADADALVLAGLGRRIEALFGTPQDIEWARDAHGFVITQARPITALPAPEADPPANWSVPHPRDFYVRASITEQLPDPLSPLFAELVQPAVSRSLVALMTEFVGPGVVAESDVSLPTVNGYAYYDYTRRGIARLTAMTWKALPVLRPRGPRSGVRRWREVARPAYREVAACWTARDPGTLADAELITGVRELLEAGLTYYTAVQAIIPVAAMGEVTFTRWYALVRRKGDPPVEAFLLGGDSAPIRADRSLWDLSRWVGEWPELRDWMVASSTETVLTGPGPTGWDEWRQRFQAHLDAYGHTVYNLDVLHPTAAERPAPLVDALRYMITGSSADPYARQREALVRRDAATAAIRGRLGRVRRKVFDRLLADARELGPLREDALADVGLAWPRLRLLILELGRRLVVAGAVPEADDVFWLRTAEITDGLAGTARDLAALAEQRRMIWRGQRRVTPPQLLPLGAFGWMRRWLPAAAEDQDGAMIKGIAGSGGRVTGVARVLSGPADFDRLQPGEILVASITTPAWTPLFAIAGAVVTDIGGPLSHSSIVAREYGIPAVLGTGVATRWATDGETLTVDGSAGTVRR